MEQLPFNTLPHLSFIHEIDPYYLHVPIILWLLIHIQNKLREFLHAKIA
jgi:hypothetical protein